MFDEPNRIPAGPIIEVVRSLLQSEGERIAEGVFTPFAVEMLAARVDVRSDTLHSILLGKKKTIDFDLADRLLCSLGAFDLWFTDLKDIYESSLLVDGERKHKVGSASGSRVCERRGCSERFVPPKNMPAKRFCSPACKHATWKYEKRGAKTALRGKDRHLEALVCRNGHERTKENTGHNNRGTRYCLICHREASAKWRKARRALAA